MNRDEAFDFLCRTAEGIAVMFGKNCETLVHDMEQPNHPILAIYNNQVSGREVGSCEDIYGDIATTPNKTALKQDYVNHLVITRKGKKIKSSTFFFEGDTYSFALGINFDFTAMDQVTQFMQELSNVSVDLESAIGDCKDNQSKMEEIFATCLASLGKPSNELNRQERIELIRLLKEKNAFQLQKSIPFVSEKLGLSRYTIYKYINETQR